MSYAKRSPILYMGNKYRLMKKGLVSLFAPNINTFIDVFAGSATVSINTNAKKFIINDIDDTLHRYYQIFQNLRASDIIKHIEKRIDEYKLPQKTTIRCLTLDKQEIEFYKNSYMNLRATYNKNGDILDLYTLMFFAFSQQFRTNSKGEFNMPFGNNCFSESNKKAILAGVDFFKSPNVRYYKEDFERLIRNLYIQENDFVYLDPPYRITTAIYNENNAWGEAQEMRLFEICKYLKNKCVNFGMSNTFCNKGVENKALIAFCKDNDLSVYSPTNFIYHACGKENLNQKEVYVCNYDIAEHHLKLANFSRIH